MIDGGTVPTPLLDRPDLDDAMAEAWRAFSEAGRDRQSGMGLGPIPYSSVLRWLDENGVVDLEERRDLCGLVFAADDEYRAALSEKEDRDRAKDKSGVD